MSVQRIQGMIDGWGETVVLRRPGTPDVDASVKASIRQYAPDQLVGGIIQGMAEAIVSDRDIAAASWPGPPRIGDKLIRDGKTLNVEAAETRTYKESVALHILRVIG